MVSLSSVGIKANFLIIETDKFVPRRVEFQRGMVNNMDEINFACHHLILNHDFYLTPSSEETGMV